MAGLGLASCFEGTCTSSEPRGNGRDFNPKASLSDSKVQMRVNFDSGRVWVGVNETCWVETTRSVFVNRSDTSCYDAQKVFLSPEDETRRVTTSGPNNGKNRVSVTSFGLSGGAGGGALVGITYDAVLAGISDKLAPHIDGHIDLAVTSGKLRVCRDRDAFPSLGTYRNFGGKTQTLVQDNQTKLGPAAGLTGLQTDSGCKSFRL